MPAFIDQWSLLTNKWAVDVHKASMWASSTLLLSEKYHTVSVNRDSVIIVENSNILPNATLTEVADVSLIRYPDSQLFLSKGAFEKGGKGSPSDKTDGGRGVKSKGVSTPSEFETGVVLHRLTP